MEEWFTLHEKQYGERKVAVRLEHHDIETCVPATESELGRSDTRPVPFFPGYMFIHLDLDTANPRTWRAMPGVRYIVSYGGVPVPVEVTEEKEKRGRRTRGSGRPIRS